MNTTHKVEKEIVFTNYNYTTEEFLQRGFYLIEKVFKNGEYSITYKFLKASKINNRKTYQNLLKKYLPNEKSDIEKLLKI